MNRSRTSPWILFACSALILAWTLVLLSTPGGSRVLEWLQLVMSLAIGGYAWLALKRNSPEYDRRCRYVLLALAVTGALIVLGLSADQRSSRTWARLGWATLILGYIGSVIAWWRLPQHRGGAIAVSAVGAFLVLSGLGLTLNCDPTIQRTWCEANYEREQSLGERIDVDGEFLAAGRAGGSTGAAQLTFVVPEDASLLTVVDPPGEWAFEERDLQPNELERGRLTTTEPPYSDCHIDAKIAPQPQGLVLTVLVGCGGVG